MVRDKFKVNIEKCDTYNDRSCISITCNGSQWVTSQSMTKEELSLVQEAIQKELQSKDKP